MKRNQKRTIMKGVPSSVQALILALVTTLLLLILAPILGLLLSLKTNTGEFVIYLFYGIVLATGCFFISKKNPSSFWYVPIIANCLVILSAAIEPTFWKTSMWIFWGSSIPLSIIMSIWGARKGKMNQNVSDS